MANRMPRDNSGVVIGQRGALVIDTGINEPMARQIQERVRKLTDKSLLYFVNTNYHGDHTFGNYLFPDPVEIVAHTFSALGIGLTAAIFLSLFIPVVKGRAKRNNPQGELPTRDRAATGADNPQIPPRLLLASRADYCLQSYQ